MDLKFLDEIDCESFFDHVEDLIDFPLENESGSLGTDDCKDFPSIWDEALPLDNAILHSDDRNMGLDLSAELAVPPEDILQLEWLSTFVEDSFADGGMTITQDNNNINKEQRDNQFQISSPISVLESSSSSSCSGGKTQRARSKRPRPTTFSTRSPMQFISTTLLFGEKPQPNLITESCSDSREQKRKKKLKLTFSSSPPEANQNKKIQPVRKCMHCEITKTPQWRAGPMGPKSLCNACGVRYKSGRLFPEYRPAASPTYVPSIHSNSHKRVIEMRNKSIDKGSSSSLSAISRPTISQSQLG